MCGRVRGDCCGGCDEGVGVVSPVEINVGGRGGIYQKVGGPTGGVRWFEWYHGRARRLGCIGSVR